MYGVVMRTTVNAKTKYWYKTTVHYCPICGSDETFRERVYQKPDKWEWHEYYDYCQE